MEASALVGIIGGILMVLLGLLITMLMNLKRDVDRRDEDTRARLEAIKFCIGKLVAQDDYKEDKKEIVLRIDEHGDRLLVLEIKAKKVAA